MKPNMTEAERIAKGLTKAQRRAINDAPRIGGGEPGRKFTRLLDLGLGNCTIYGDDDGERWRFTLTPLGLAVRNHLQKDTQHG